MPLGGLAACALLTVVACGRPQQAAVVARAAQPPTPQQSKLATEIATVKANLTRDLYDPWSVRYRNVEIVPLSVDGGGVQPHVYCGEINAKNRFGAYIGFQHFLSFAQPLTADQHADIDDPSSSYRSIGWDVFCKGKTGVPVQF